MTIPRALPHALESPQEMLSESSRIAGQNVNGAEMALQEPQAEPSMEEILASIRRIISEEEQAPPVLDLTQTEHVPEAPPAPLEDDDLVFEAVEDVVVAEMAPEPAPAPVYVAAPTPTPSEAILSQPTASAAAVSIARLVGSLRISESPNQTIEGVVRELLKPMLREWLDQNLAAIVEARVEAELERIARLAR